MNIGDTVEILGQTTFEDGVGKISEFLGSRIEVEFPDGWRRYYKPEEVRVIEAETTKGARR